MPLSDDDEILLVLLSRRKKIKRKHWINPYNLKNADQGTFVVTRELRNDPVKFHSFYQMSPETFDKLCSIAGPAIRRKNTKFRQAICVEERLMITLRFLATGASFRALSLDFMRGETSIGQIVGETCSALWMCLQPVHMPEPTTEMWMQISKKYEDMCQMPNCTGSLDGKLIRIRCPSKTGSASRSNLPNFSVILIAVADTDGKFTLISVGDYGSNSDGSIFKNSEIGKWLFSGCLNFPEPKQLPGDPSSPLPFYFVADETFPLHEHIMRPYPQRGLTNEKRVFNARLSRALKTVDCAFSRLSSKFRCLHTSIGCSIQRVIHIVQACCVLHNFIINSEPLCIEQHEESSLNFGIDLPVYKGRFSDVAILNRVALTNFFLKPENSLPWQDNYCI